MQTKNAEFKAGIVVLLALGVLLTLLWFAGGAENLFARTRTITLRFEQGYAAPKSGDPVLMNGFEVGTVSQVVQKEEIRTGDQLTPADRAKLRLRPEENGTAREIYVLATVRMPKEQKIPDGTTAEVSVDVTGSRHLALLPGLSLRDLSDEDTRRNPIHGRAAGGIEDVARSVQSLVEKVAGLVDRGSLVLDDVRTTVGAVRKQVDAIHLEKIQENLEAGTADLRKALESIRKGADDILVKVAEAAASVRGAAADAQGIVRGVQEDVQAFLKSLREIASNLNGIVIRAAPKVDALLDELAKAGRAASAMVEEFRGLPAQAKAILAQTGDDMGRVLDRLETMGHNLADASEDLRAHPWLLLNKPDPKAIAFENLRDSMRNYVRAAERVQAATRELQLLGERTDVGDADKKLLLDRALSRLRADLAKYEEFAQILLRLLQENAGAPTSPR